MVLASAEQADDRGAELTFPAPAAINDSMKHYPVSPSKVDDLRRRMQALGLTEDAFEERFFCPNQGRLRKRGSQVAVRLRHLETNTTVSCQRSTSQSLNRFLARRMLVRQLEKRQDCTRSPISPLAPPPFSSSPGESSAQHMHRMFARSFEKDIAQPYPIPSQKLLGAGEPPAKLIGILGEREIPTGPASTRRG